MKNEIKGKAKGGFARAAKLSPEERKEIARQGAAARWSDSSEGANLLKATHEAPLKIGDHVIKCAVLEDGTRVITQRSVYSAMGRSGSTGGLKPKEGAQELPRILAATNLSAFISDKLRCAITPILFKQKRGGNAYGYGAEILPEICNVYLEAREARVLNRSQQRVAAKCEVLIRGFARVGIIALIDEATGYQYDRDRDALYKILEAYVAKELLPWARRFDPDYYKELFRLRGWQYTPLSVARPILVGKLTNMLIYDRLPPGVKEELQKQNPKDIKTGRRKHKYFQFLTTDIGIPHLDKLLAITITLMKISPNWKKFISLFNRAVPKPGTTPFLPFYEDEIDKRLCP